jgi:hypothetical protein
VDEQAEWPNPRAREVFLRLADSQGEPQWDEPGGDALAQFLAFDRPNPLQRRGGGVGSAPDVGDDNHSQSEPATKEETMHCNSLCCSTFARFGGILSFLRERAELALQIPIIPGVLSLAIKMRARTSARLHHQASMLTAA